jgi:hypothetical protein
MLIELFIEKLNRIKLSEERPWTGPCIDINNHQTIQLSARVSLATPFDFRSYPVAALTAKGGEGTA